MKRRKRSAAAWQAATRDTAAATTAEAVTAAAAAAAQAAGTAVPTPTTAAAAAAAAVACRGPPMLHPATGATTAAAARWSRSVCRHAGASRALQPPVRSSSRVVRGMLCGCRAIAVAAVRISEPQLLAALRPNVPVARTCCVHWPRARLRKSFDVLRRLRLRPGEPGFDGRLATELNSVDGPRCAVCVRSSGCAAARARGRGRSSPLSRAARHTRMWDRPRSVSCLPAQRARICSSAVPPAAPGRPQDPSWCC